jgi:phospholipid/cholesterol/gamma-HCH transport system substrate-binding protein
MIAGLLLVVGSVVAMTSSGSDTSLHLVGQFKDASPLLPGNQVMLNGVKVGSVDSIKLVGRMADVAISVDKDALPVHSDARLTIKPVTLLGERYIDLNQGTASAPLIANNAVIPASRTGADVTLSDVLNTLDKPTSASLAGMVGSLGTGLDGNGANTAAALKLLAPVMNNASAFASVLQSQNQTLSNLVSSLSKVASGVAADQGHAMDSLIAAADTVTASTAQNEAAFRSTLQQLPGTLSAARATLSQLAATANNVTPTLASLRPTTDQLPALSNELNNFATAANPALEAANPVLAQATTLLAQLRPVVSVLEKNIDATTSDAKSLGTLTNTVGPRFTSVMAFVRNWALATNGSDGLGHYFRGLVILTPYMAGGLLPVGSITGAKGTRSGSLLSGLTGTLGNLLGNTTKGLLKLPQSLLSPKTTSNDGSTGLTLKQELGAVSSLLGGN